MKSTVFVGVDLHKDSLTLCVMLPNGTRRFETLPTKCRNRIRDFFTQLASKHRVLATVESVGFYHWFWDLVCPLVHKLFLADASGVRTAAGRRAKTDRNDAETLAMFEHQLLRIEDLITQTLDATPRFQAPVERLQTIPGIGRTTAAVIHAETGGLQRFDLEGEIICYAGLAPRTFQSADHCRHGAIGKDGPPIMRKCLINAAWAAVRTDPDVKRRFEQYRRTKGKKKAIVKLAAKILAWAWAMERTGTPFDVGRLRAAHA